MTKHVVIFKVDGIKLLVMSRRTNKIILSPEASILRELRTKAKLSMRAAGALMGYSDSYISQIENGRENPPKGRALKAFLKIYGGYSEKAFKERCRRWTAKSTDQEVITELLPKLNKTQMQMIRTMIEQVLKS